MFLSLTIIREKIIRVKAGPRGRLGLCPDGGCAARVVHRVRAVCIGGVHPSSGATACAGA